LLAHDLGVFLLTKNTPTKIKMAAAAFIMLISSPKNNIAMMAANNG
jgi:hypothetical protein